MTDGDLSVKVPQHSFMCFSFTLYGTMPQFVVKHSAARFALCDSCRSPAS